MIGTDFLAKAPPRATEQPQYEIEPTPMVYASPEPDPPVRVIPSPARDETRWASTQGDIMDALLLAGDELAGGLENV